MENITNMQIQRSIKQKVFVKYTTFPHNMICKSRKNTFYKQIKNNLLKAFKN